MDVLLKLVVTDVNEPIWNDKIGSSPGCSNHELWEFTVLRDMGQEKSKVWTLNLKKAHFQLFKEFISRTPWETGLRDKRVEKIFEDAFHRVQEIVMPRCKESGKEDKSQHG